MNAELKRLAKLFPPERPLYAVGGCVRDEILGREVFDIDLTSACLQEEAEKYAKAAGMRVLLGSKRLGTVMIKGEKSYEYTPFRVDSYPAGSGVHKPASVRFTEDIEEDARRRDFTVNALYYDILRGDTLDLLGGKADLDARLLRAVDDPRRVLGEDGLRIMRLYRFVAVLGFSAEEKTAAAAREMSGLLGDIAPERIRVELDKLLAGEHAAEGLRGLIGCGAMRVIMPEFCENIGVKQDPAFHMYDVDEHILRTVEYAPPRLRLAALLHDIGKGRCVREEGNMYRHAQVSAQMAEEIMTRLRYSKEQTRRTVRLVSAHMTDMRGDMRESKLRRFVANNADIIDDLTELIIADARAACGNADREKCLRISRLRDKMQKEGVPFGVGELAINGNDVMAFGYKGEEIGKVLNELFDLCLRGEKKNERKILLDILEKRKNAD